jgi:dihydroorotate dehydrogenase (NAD+) catalytic subunit
MNYKRVKIEEILNSDCDFKIFRTDESMSRSTPGQFVFAWLPGVGEKPFSIMDDEPLTLGILERGEFTGKFNRLQEGDSFYIRGPYGQGVDILKSSDVALVGGGCGIAGLYLLAKRLSKGSNVKTFLAAKDKDHIPYVKEFEKYGEVEIATEDGSLGRKGRVTDLLRDSNSREGSYFFNCGPKAMIDAVLPLELKVSNPNIIYSSLDYMTRCGVGICGSCSDKKGRRTCVEGPFISS